MDMNARAGAGKQAMKTKPPRVSVFETDTFAEKV